MDCSLTGSSVHGIFQVRILEWGAISFSRGSSWPRDRTQVSRIAGRRFTIWATSEAHFKLNSESTVLIQYIKKLGPEMGAWLFWSCFPRCKDISGASLMSQTVKSMPAMWETRVLSLGQEDPLEKEMATHSSILVWRIPCTEEPGSYSPWGYRVRHDWAASTSIYTSACVWCIRCLGT